jgi:hypothetical protein
MPLTEIVQLIINTLQTIDQEIVFISSSLLNTKTATYLPGKINFLIPINQSIINACAAIGEFFIIPLLERILKQREILHYILHRHFYLIKNKKIKFSADPLAIDMFRSQGIGNGMLAEDLNVDRTTLYRRTRNTINQDRFTRLTEEEIIKLVTDCHKSLPNAGYRMIVGLILSKHIYLRKEQVRKILAQIDPIGTAARKKHRLKRRVYSVPCANSLWHLDGNHKLIPWKFVIHGCIDGFSRFIMYCKCSTNNKSITMAQLFYEACDKYFIPSRVRGDKGGENALIKQFMNINRGPNRGSFIEGKSVHNQRIERFWSDAFNTVNCLYYKLFSEMEISLLLDINNHIHLYVLHYIYLPLINRSLDEFTQAWNRHPVSTEKNLTPCILWYRGMKLWKDNPADNYQPFTVLGPLYRNLNWQEIEAKQNREYNNNHYVRCDDIPPPAYLTQEQNKIVENMAQTYVRNPELYSQDVYCAIVNYINSCLPGQL